MFYVHMCIYLYIFIFIFVHIYICIYLNLYIFISQPKTQVAHIMSYTLRKAKQLYEQTDSSRFFYTWQPFNLQTKSKHKKDFFPPGRFKESNRLKQYHRRYIQKEKSHTYTYTETHINKIQTLYFFYEFLIIQTFRRAFKHN